MENTRQNLFLLEKAQAIFGKELVVDAHICTWQVGPTPEKVLEARLNEEEASFVSLQHTDTQIFYHGLTIRLTFCNGKIVEFSNSEWATMESVNRD